MRRILFRGKNLFGKWIEGDLIQYIIYGKMHIARNSWGGRWTRSCPGNCRSVHRGDGRKRQQDF